MECYKLKHLLFSLFWMAVSGCRVKCEIPEKSVLNGRYWELSSDAVGWCVCDLTWELPDKVTLGDKALAAFVTLCQSSSLENSETFLSDLSSLQLHVL